MSEVRMVEGHCRKKHCHSGARPKGANPGSINTGLWNMDSGFAAAWRPGMTNSCPKLLEVAT